MNSKPRHQKLRAVGGVHGKEDIEEEQSLGHASRRSPDSESRTLMEISSMGWSPLQASPPNSLIVPVATLREMALATTLHSNAIHWLTVYSTQNQDAPPLSCQASVEATGFRRLLKAAKKQRGRNCRSMRPDFHKSQKHQKASKKPNGSRIRATLNPT